MRDLTLPRTYIFSVNQNRDYNLDRKAFIKVLRDLESRRIPYKVLEGSYNSVLEDSIAVFDPVNEPGKYSSTVERIAMDYNQESVLMVLENDRKALLKYLNKPLPPENLGVFKSVPKDHALKNRSYSYDPGLDLYFIAE